MGSDNQEKKMSLVDWKKELVRYRAMQNQSGMEATTLQVIEDHPKNFALLIIAALTVLK